ncbi:MAG: sigma 54-interacting transcriptional regulator [Desulfobacula sp.]|jgi:PAS domain S-box-containing protein|nr:sigma 54-interacting transcriptional regulator [Desulfobacula sp.]
MFEKKFSLHDRLNAKDFELIFESIMKHSKDGLFVVDSTGMVVMVNRATEEMFDFKSSQVLGRNVKDLVDEGFYEPSVSALVIKQKKAISLIQTTRNKKKILSTGIPIFNTHDEILFVLVNDRDISHINRLAETLDIEDIQQENLRMDFSDLGLAANHFESMVIKSPAMEKIIRTAIRASKYDVPLLITGRSGVGKSMIAKLTHQLSDRRHFPFADLNCGSITASLIESELFGHESGAFTGASQKGKKGLFEIADKGTLFLDEIGEIPLPAQAKLLKFLESMELMRVGGIKSIKINTRIIAATNRNLEQMVEEKLFRSDLYFRLNVVPLEIPALEERKEEIVPLATFFLNQLNKKFKTCKLLSKSAQNLICEYHFPGNIRELENLMKRLVTMTEGDVIEAEHLPSIFLQTNVSSSVSIGKENYKETINAFELKIINKVIKKYGSQRKAAKVLGISQSTLSRKMKNMLPPLIVH